MTRTAGVVLVAVATLLVSCSADQDPGIVPTPADATATTSRTLSPCPPGGPDETTPAAGCLDEDGTVVRP